MKSGATRVEMDTEQGILIADATCTEHICDVHVSKSFLSFSFRHGYFLCVMHYLRKCMTSSRDVYIY